MTLSRLILVFLLLPLPCCISHSYDVMQIGGTAKITFDGDEEGKTVSLYHEKGGLIFPTREMKENLTLIIRPGTVTLKIHQDNKDILEQKLTLTHGETIEIKIP